MSAMSSAEHAELVCAAGLGLFNHRTFVSNLKDACQNYVNSTGKQVSANAFLNILEKQIRKSARSKLFTTSFDIVATADPSPELVTARLQKVKKFHLKKGQGQLKANARGACISRKALSLAFGTQCSVLLGRNAYSLLEQHYEARCKPQGRPTWLNEPGSLMGPGALIGANILAEELRNFQIQTSSFTDMVRNYELSTIAVKRWKRLLREELVSLLQF